MDDETKPAPVESTEAAQSAATQSAAADEATKKKNKKVLIIVGVVVGVLILLSIAGTLLAGMFATKMAETAIGAATGGKVDISQGGKEVTIKGDDGEDLKVSSAAKVPDGFPDSVPVYDGAKVVHAQTTTVGDEQDTYNLMLQTGDSVEKVSQYYDKAFSKENGWKSLSRSASGDYVQINVLNEAKDVGVMMAISLDDDNGQTNVHIITRNQVIE